jgi:hypothetical protein
MAVKYPSGSRDESRPYAGIVEAFHQLHCLVSIHGLSLYINRYTI